MSCQQVPTAPAFNPYPRSVQVGEFEVAIGGGIWVAIGDPNTKGWGCECGVESFVDPTDDIDAENVIGKKILWKS